MTRPAHRPAHWRDGHLDLGPGQLKIEGLRRVEGVTSLGHDTTWWEAWLIVSGTKFRVDDKYGSWQVVPPDDRVPRRFVLPQVASDLQDEVHAEEKRLGLPPLKERHALH